VSHRRRAAKDEPIRYVVATHGWLEGARLSKCGHWGNEPFPDVDAATAAAQADAGDRPFTVERLTVKRQRPEG
jgi:hypothetical protein